MKIRKMTIPAPLLVALLVVASVGATIMYLRTVPSSFTVSVNTFEVQLFTDEACTIVATSVEFDSFMIGHPTIENITSSVYYMKAVELAQNTHVRYDHDAPSPLILTAQYAWTSAPSTWYNWAQTTQSIGLSLGNDMIHVRFNVDPQGASAGQYSFDIELTAGDS